MIATRYRLVADLQAEIAKGWDGEKSNLNATQIAQQELDKLGS